MEFLCVTFTQPFEIQTEWQVCTTYLMKCSIPTIIQQEITFHMET